MADALLRRVFQAVVTLLAASALVWSLQGLAPGDPARRVLAANGVTHPNDVQVAIQREALGLDGNPLARYGHWLSHAIRGDLGRSWVSGQPVASGLVHRLPATLVLAVTALGLSLLMALGLGLLAAAFPWRWPDTLARGLSLGALVLPSFLVGSVLLQIVVVRWGYFRVVADGHWSTVLLPAVALSLGPAAVWSRLLRAALLDAHAAGHVDVARGRGASRVRLLFVHDLPNALVPFLTVFGAGAATLLGGAPIIEMVFTWPGIGRLAVQAITARDVPVVQGFTLLAVLGFVVVSMLVDLAAMAIDPRTRPEPGRRLFRLRRQTAAAR